MKSRVLAGLAFCASILIAGCGDPLEGLAEEPDATMPGRFDAASADPLQSGQAGRILEKPAPLLPPTR